MSERRKVACRRRGQKAAKGCREGASGQHDPTLSGPEPPARAFVLSGPCFSASGTLARLPRTPVCRRVPTLLSPKRPTRFVRGFVFRGESFSEIRRYYPFLKQSDCESVES